MGDNNPNRENYSNIYFYTCKEYKILFSSKSVKKHIYCSSQCLKKSFSKRQSMILKSSKYKFSSRTKSYMEKSFKEWLDMYICYRYFEQVHFYNHIDRKNG